MLSSMIFIPLNELSALPQMKNVRRKGQIITLFRPQIMTVYRKRRRGKQSLWYECLIMINEKKPLERVFSVANQSFRVSNIVICHTLWLLIAHFFTKKGQNVNWLKRCQTLYLWIRAWHNNHLKKDLGTKSVENEESYSKKEFWWTKK